MIHETFDLVRLLIEMGAFTEEDVRNIQVYHIEAILALLVDRRAILPEEWKDAESILNRLVYSRGRVSRAKAQYDLVKMLTKNLHRRMKVAGESIEENRKKITSGNHPAVYVPLKSEE